MNKNRTYITYQFSRVALGDLVIIEHTTIYPNKELFNKAATLTRALLIEKFKKMVPNNG